MCDIWVRYGRSMSIIQGAYFWFWECKNERFLIPKNATDEKTTLSDKRIFVISLKSEIAVCFTTVVVVLKIVGYFFACAKILLIDYLAQKNLKVFSLRL